MRTSVIKARQLHSLWRRHEGEEDPQVDAFVYAWGNNPKRATYKGRTCYVEARGKMRSVLIRFENGERTVTSERALRKV